MFRSPPVPLLTTAPVHLVHLVLIALLTCSALGCRPDQPEAPRGAPVLLSVYWKAGGTSTKVWSREPDAAAPPSVAGEMIGIDFVFDRRLDGNRIEDLVNGVATPKANPPIALRWPNSETVMSVPPFEAQVRYNSLPVYGGETSVVLLSPRFVGVPSATTVTLSLDRANLASAYGEPMDGPDAIDVSVAPLTVEARPTVPADALVPVPTAYAFRISFNNRPGATAALVPYTRVMADGTAVPFRLAADGNDPTAIQVSPATCPGAWPSGALVEVAFDPGLPDAFNVPTTIAQPAGTFLVAGSPTSPPDAGCD